LAVDYAIHFLSRSRSLFERFKSWADTAGPVFGEPARAITRNVIVVGVGFLPLLAAPLVPYQTVGLFIAAILLTAGAATLLILPSLFTVLEGWLFPRTAARAFACHCGTCIIASIAAVVAVVVQVYRFVSVGWTTLSWISVGVVIVSAVICRLVSRREACVTDESSSAQKGES
jgi:hypothetical protein